jgi:hypothetical protein
MSLDLALFSESTQTPFFEIGVHLDFPAVLGFAIMLILVVFSLAILSIPLRVERRVTPLSGDSDGGR